MTIVVELLLFWVAADHSSLKVLVSLFTDFGETTHLFLLLLQSHVLFFLHHPQLLLLLLLPYAVIFINMPLGSHLYRDLLVCNLALLESEKGVQLLAYFAPISHRVNFMSMLQFRSSSLL